MGELAALAGFYSAFALLHASATGRLRTAPQPLQRLARPSAALGLLAALSALASQHGGIGALLVGTAVFAAVAAIVVLTAPVFPRLIWSLAVLGMPFGLVVGLCACRC